MGDKGKTDEMSALELRVYREKLEADQKCGGPHPLADALRDLEAKRIAKELEEGEND